MRSCLDLLKLYVECKCEFVVALNVNLDMFSVCPLVNIPHGHAVYEGADGLGSLGYQTGASEPPPDEQHGDARHTAVITTPGSVCHDVAPHPPRRIVLCVCLSQKKKKKKRSQVITGKTGASRGTEASADFMLLSFHTSSFTPPPSCYSSFAPRRAPRVGGGAGARRRRRSRPARPRTAPSTPR